MRRFCYFIRDRVIAHAFLDLETGFAPILTALQTQCRTDNEVTYEELSDVGNGMSYLYVCVCVGGLTSDLVILVKKCPPHPPNFLIWVWKTI